MIRKLRLRFIRTAMAALGAVLLVLLISLNLITRYSVYKDIDRRLVFLAEGRIGPPQGMLDQTPDEMRGWIEINDAAIMEESSYFIFDGYMTLDVRENQIRRLSETLGTDAGNVMRSILGGAKDFGAVGSYRYYCAQRENPYRLVFLRCESEFSSLHRLLINSVLVGFGVFALVSLLLTVISKRVTKPFADNVESQKRFISNAGHELKTPLGVIVSDLDMQVLESGASEWLENARMQADHLALLIEQLTSYALLDEKKHRTAEVPLELSALAEALCADFAPLAASNGQTLTCEPAPGVTVSGNEDAFRTLLSVLLENAVKYTPAGGMITVRVYRSLRAVMEVENTCEPPEPEALDRLFERFYRGAKHQYETAGSGLGLSIAREITELYGGAIAAARTDDGLRFTVTLPLTGGS